MITKISEQSDFVALTKLLNDAFGTVAKEFGLTKENCPTNNAFITCEELKSQLSDSREFYGYADKDKITGFIAIERSSRDPDTFYIEKVAVHPDYRHQHLGHRLMDFASQRIWELGGKRISIGLIDSNKVLKDWYMGQGFSFVEVKIYEHLPFDVCMMEKKLEGYEDRSDKE